LRSAGQKKTTLKINPIRPVLFIDSSFRSQVQGQDITWHWNHLCQAVGSVYYFSGAGMVNPGLNFFQQFNLIPKKK
jgi:hypothetical protein